MDRRLCTRWQVLPDLVSRKHEDRRDHPRKCIHDLEQRSLRRPPCFVTRRKRVKPILDDVEITRREANCRPVEQSTIDVVKLVSFVRREHFLCYATQLGERPAVDLFPLLVRHSVACRIEAVEIAEREPRSVAELA